MGGESKIRRDSSLYCPMTRPIALQPCITTATRKRGAGMYKHILLPTDGSKLSTKGVHQAIKMARALRAKITAVHVVASYHQIMRDQEDGFMMPVIATLKEDFEDRAVARAKEIL